MQFKDKVVLITGGSRGIGRAIAQQFAEQGARLAINYRSNTTAAKATLAELPTGDHYLFQADITDPQEVKTLVDDVVAQMGRLDILINNAAIYEEHPITEVSYETWSSWQNTLNSNLLSAANLIYCAAHYMIKQGGGRVVNVSSRGAFRGEPTAPAYGASKAALTITGKNAGTARHIY